jgi:ATP phosphoribosyltransferase
MAKSKQQQLEEVEQKIQELTKEKKQLEQDVEEEKLEDLIKNTTIGSTVVWKEKGQEKKAEVEKISKKSVGVTINGKPKSIRWGKIVRTE